MTDQFDNIGQQLSKLGYLSSYGKQEPMDMPVNPFTVSAQMPALPGEAQREYEARLRRFLAPKTIGDKIARWFWRR